MLWGISNVQEPFKDRKVNTIKYHNQFVLPTTFGYMAFFWNMGYLLGVGWGGTTPLRTPIIPIIALCKLNVAYLFILTNVKSRGYICCSCQRFKRPECGVVTAVTKNNSGKAGVFSLCFHAVPSLNWEENSDSEDPEEGADAEAYATQLFIVSYRTQDYYIREGTSHNWLGSHLSTTN